MQNLIIAYLSIAVVLIVYGVSLYRRTDQVEKSIRALKERDE